MSGCDSLAIKHAVSGLCCLWVLGLLGCPGPSSGGVESGRQDHWRAPAIFQGPRNSSPRPGKVPAPPLNTGITTTPCSPRAASPLLPAAPACCGYCDIDTTASEQRQGTGRPDPYPPHAPPKWNIRTEQPSSCRSPSTGQERWNPCKPLPSPRQKAPEQPQPLFW